MYHTQGHTGVQEAILFVWSPMNSNKCTPMHCRNLVMEPPIHENTHSSHVALSTCTREYWFYDGVKHMIFKRIGELKSAGGYKADVHKNVPITWLKLLFNWSFIMSLKLIVLRYTVNHHQCVPIHCLLTQIISYAAQYAHQVNKP